MIYEGETKNIVKSAAASTAFAPGDLVYQVNGSAYPASHMAYVSGTLAATQAVLVASFLGENLDTRLATQTRVEPITIAVAGRSIKTIASAGPYYVGQLFGPDGDGSHLLSQQLVAVSSLSDATHVLVDDVPASSTSVKVALLGTGLTYGE